MLIEIKKDIFEEAKPKDLNYIFQILSWCPSNSSSRYDFFVDLEGVSNTTNFSYLRSIDNDLINLLSCSFDDFVTFGSGLKAADYKITHKRGKNCFNIEEASCFFNQPVSIIVENNKNDCIFFETIIEHFGCSHSNKAKLHLENNWLQFQNAGGCSNLPNFIQGFLNQYRFLADKNNRSPSDYFRGIIFIDSDLDFPNQDSKHKQLLLKLNDFIDLKDVHILKKRAMENYLPDEVYFSLKKQPAIKNDSELKDWIDAYLPLEKSQKDYLNISSGFPPNQSKFDSTGSRKPVLSEILSLFNLKSSDINFKKLDIGFKFNGFKNDGTLNYTENFKNAFPSLFKKPCVNKVNLNLRDGIGELDEILNKIENLL